MGIDQKGIYQTDAGNIEKTVGQAHPTSAGVRGQATVFAYGAEANSIWKTIEEPILRASNDTRILYTW